MRAVSAAEMRELDRLAETRYGVSPDRLMENAGREVALAVKKLFPGKKSEQLKFLALCGRGNNGGDGLVAARYLLQYGFCAQAFVIAPPDGEQYGKLVLRNIKRAFLAHVSVRAISGDMSGFKNALKQSDVVIDALLGTGSSGAPRGAYAGIIRLVNRAEKLVCAVDIPSGLDPDTGKPYSPCIRADRTFTLGLPKHGLLEKRAAAYTGKTSVLDIGLPKELIYL